LPAPYPKSMRVKVVELNGKGYNDKEIAEEMGVSQIWVWHVRKKLGIPPVKYHPLSKEVNKRIQIWGDKITELNKKGYNDHEIAKRIGLNFNKVYRLRMALGIQSVPHCRIPKKVKDKIIALYNKGLNDFQISEKVGIARTTITKMRRTYNLPAHNVYSSQCVICEKPFQGKAPNQRYCPDCVSRIKKETRLSWNKLTHIINRCGLNGVEAWKRDKGRCKRCGKNGEVIHHIDHNDENNNLENLVVLCTSCHCEEAFYYSLALTDKANKRIFWNNFIGNNRTKYKIKEF